VPLQVKTDKVKNSTFKISVRVVDYCVKQCLEAVYTHENYNRPQENVVFDTSRKRECAIGGR